MKDALETAAPISSLIMLIPKANCPLVCPGQLKYNIQAGEAGQKARPQPLAFGMDAGRGG